jgi:predicted porin
MKKSLLALAILGAISGSVFAQSSVTVYGVVDAGVASESGAVTTNKLTSGMQSGSRLGFRGTEDLGNGVKANFVLETGLNVDTGSSGQGGLAFGRQSFVGLSSDTMGTLSAGRQYNALYTTLLNVGDPFQFGLAGTSTNLFSTGGGRINNSVKYSSPTIAGFSGDVMYGFGEAAGSTVSSRNLGGSVGYVTGPVNVRLAYQEVNDAAATDNAKHTLLAASYDFGVVKANAAFAVNKGVGSLDSRDYLIGASVPFGPSKFLVSYMKKDDRTSANMSADQIAVGYTYDLSKRTNLYTSYARISNDNGAMYTVGNASEVGTGDRAFNVGVRHSF